MSGASKSRPREESNSYIISNQLITKQMKWFTAIFIIQQKGYSNSKNNDQLPTNAKVKHDNEEEKRGGVMSM